MALHQPSTLTRLQQRLRLILTGPPAFALLPAISLATYWFGGEGALIVVSGLVPVLYLVGAGLHDRSITATGVTDGILNRAAFEELANKVHACAGEDGREAAILCLALEDFDQLRDRYGQGAAEAVVRRSGERLISTLRDGDRVAQIGDAKFAICTDAVGHLDLEMCIQLTNRIQSTIEEPISIDGISIYVSASIGFCQRSRAPAGTGVDWLDAANIALREAQRRGPSAIRAYSDHMRHAKRSRQELREEVTQALNKGQILPWFQPQISTDTGRVTGFEALARWEHPDRGMMPPAEFLLAIEEAG